MNPDRLFTQTAQIVSGTVTASRDVWGNLNAGASITTEVRCFVHPVDSSEITDRTEGRFTHRAYLPAGTTIDHGDEFILADGRSWFVSGPPKLHHNPRTSTDEFLEVDLVGYTYEQTEESS